MHTVAWAVKSPREVVSDNDLKHLAEVVTAKLGKGVECTRVRNLIMFSSFSAGSSKLAAASRRAVEEYWAA